ncbi:hypothetical protein GCM10027186_19520 [Micromonospora schwarzwaldensis]
MVASPRAWSARATATLRGLCRELPLPWANKTIPPAPEGTATSPTSPPSTTGTETSRTPLTSAPRIPRPSPIMKLTVEGGSLLTVEAGRGAWGCLDIGGKV